MELTLYRKFALLVFLCLVMAGIANAQWYYTPQTQWGGNIKMVDENVGYGMKLSNLIKTTDGGISWNSIQIGQNENIEDFSMLSSGTGYAVNAVGDIYKTKDNGSTWCKIGSLGYFVNRIQFVNDSVGYAMSSVGGFFKTTDGGFNWLYKPFATGQYHDMRFTSDNVGFILGGGKLRITYDGGNNWFEEIAITGFYLWVRGSQRIWVMTNDKMYRSTNGGVTWDTTNMGTNFGTKIQFVSGSVGGRITSFGYERSIDGGATWSTSSGVLPGVKLISFDLSTISKGVALDELGNYYITSDGGASWSITSNGLSMRGRTNIYDVFAANNTTAYMVNNQGECLRTTNQGMSWNIVKSFPSPILLVATTFTSNAKMGGVVGQSGMVATTNDSGVTWTERTLNSSTVYYDIIYQNSDFIAIGSGGAIRRGTHFQTAWTGISGNTTQTLRSIAFPTSQVGYIVGHGGVILKTTDGGSTWQSQTSGTTQNLIKVYFKSATEGMAVGTGGTVLYTANGGVTWTSFASNTQEHFLSLILINSNQWIITGNNGNIYMKNGPAPIQFVQSIGGGNPLNSIDFFDNNNGIMAANNGFVLQYKVNCNASTPVVYNISDQQIICNGDSAILYASGSGKIKWYASANAPSEVAIGQRFVTPNINSNTTYFVEDSGCVVSSRIPVAVTTATPPSVSSQESLQQLLCTSGGGGKRFIASANNGYVKWYENWPNITAAKAQSDTFFAYPPSFGIYQYVAFAELGYCKSEPLVFTLEVRSRERFSGLIDTNIICSGQTVTLNIGLPGDFVLWWADTVNRVGLGGSGNTYISPALTADTQFYATLQRAGDCPFFDVVLPVKVKTLPDVTITKGIDSSLQVASLTGAYQWFDCTNATDITGATARLFNPSQTGSYGVRVELDGCSDTSDCVFIQVIPIGLAEEANFKSEVYPIPATSNLVITTAMKDVNLLLYDILGKAVMSQQLVDEQTILDLTTLTNGTYTLVLKSGESSYVRKVIITK